MKDIYLLPLKRNSGIWFDPHDKIMGNSDLLDKAAEMFFAITILNINCFREGYRYICINFMDYNL